MVDADLPGHRRLGEVVGDRRLHRADRTRTAMEAHDPVAPLLAAIVVPADDELFVALAELRQRWAARRR